MPLLRIALALALAAGCSKSSPDKGQASEREAEKPPERTGIVFRGEKSLTLVGETPEVGDQAPDFELVAGNDLEPLTLADFDKKTLILSVVPSIDTRVCEVQTHRMTDEEASLPDDVALLTVSRDLPFAQTRFVEEARIESQLASDYKGGHFGRAFGLEVKESGLLARSVWVVAPDGTIAYRQLVEDQGSEPDYEPLFAAARETAGGT